MKQQAALCFQHQHLSSLQLNSIHISGDLYQTVGRQVISYCCLAELSSGKQPILAQINGSQGSNSYDRVLEWSFFDLKICSKPVTLHELDFQRKEEKKSLHFLLWEQHHIQEQNRERKFCSLFYHFTCIENNFKWCVHA